MKEYDYQINTERLPRPVGRKLRCLAFVAFMYEETDTGRRPVEHDFGKACGRTEEEAIEGMEERIDFWKAEQD